MVCRRMVGSSSPGPGLLVLGKSWQLGSVDEETQDEDEDRKGRHETILSGKTGEPSERARAHCH